jgi:hypothetical protein
MSDADYVQGGIAVTVIVLCGVNIFLTIGTRTAIWRITKRIDSLRELVRKHYEVTPKKSRPNTQKQGRNTDD